jgi:L-seryl-tRNA(Ser) seleniumtransferase
LVLGRTEVVERLRRHPLARAVRADKTTLAALEATLRGPQPPVWQALEADPAVLRERCGAVLAALPAELDASVVPVDGVVGGGGAPGLRLPGSAVALPEAYAALLRTGTRPVLARVERGVCLVDLRCVQPEQDAAVAAAIRAAAGAASATLRP